MIAHYIDHPYRKAGKTAAEMLRKKKPKKMREPKQGRNGERRRKKKEVLQSVLSAEVTEYKRRIDLVCSRKLNAPITFL